MAKDKKIGRNDRCPCGSGRKYKNCCQSKAGRMGPLGWAGVLALIAAVAVVAVSLLNAGRGDSNPTAAPNQSCPAGQVWSAEHGHCHSP